MMQSRFYIYSLIGTIGILSSVAYADNTWSGYSSVERHSHYPAQSAYQAPAQDPFTFSNQRNLPAAQPRRYYQPQPRVRIEYYPDTQYDYSYQQESFVIGNALPMELRNEQYVIRDWDYYSLRRPPQGRHWVIINGRYLLVTDDNFIIEIIR